MLWSTGAISLDNSLGNSTRNIAGPEALVSALMFWRNLVTPFRDILSLLIAEYFFPKIDGFIDFFKIDEVIDFTQN